MRHGQTRLRSAAMGRRVGFKTERRHAFLKNNEAVFAHDLL